MAAAAILDFGLYFRFCVSECIRLIVLHVPWKCHVDRSIRSKGIALFVSSRYRHGIAYTAFPHYKNLTLGDRKFSVFGEFGGEDEKLHFWPQSEGTSLRETASLEPLTIKICSAVRAVARSKKREKKTKQRKHSNFGVSPFRFPRTDLHQIWNIDPLVD